MAITLCVLAAASAPDTDIPLPWLSTYIQDETVRVETEQGRWAHGGRQSEREDMGGSKRVGRRLSLGGYEGGVGGEGTLAGGAEERQGCR